MEITYAKEYARQSKYRDQQANFMNGNVKCFDDRRESWGQAGNAHYCQQGNAENDIYVNIVE